MIFLIFKSFSEKAYFNYISKIKFSEFREKGILLATSSPE